MKAIEEVCPLCQNTNGEHKPWCPRNTPKEWRTDDKPTGRFRCLACGQEWEGRYLYRNSYGIGANVWGCGNLQCGGNVVEVYTAKPATTDKELT